jgi:hypothetical protein
MHDLPTFQALTGQESHGFNVVPGFADPPGADYSLDTSSDLIDVGVLIPGINHDFVGTAPDIGAFEYEGDGFTMIASPQIQAIDPGGTAIFTLDLQPIGDYSETVSLSASPPSPSQTLSLDPENVELPGQATITITDYHTSVENGLWYSISITGETDAVMQEISVALLVGGSRLFLPLVNR